MSPASGLAWEFWIDRGGTFTDCIGRAPDGRIHTAKLLSSDEAPVAGVRALLARAGHTGTAPGARIKIGTTVATNALLERRGEPTLLVANRGLGDLLEIGTQERPELFELQIRKPSLVHARVLEVSARVGAKGERLAALDEDALRAGLGAARDAGIRSVAVALIHGYAHPGDERRVAAVAREIGFEEVVASHEVARELGLLARAETTVVDAYLTPRLRAHARHLAEAFPDAELRFMQSSGGLTDARRFRGPHALLSGPAGGVVGAACVARDAGSERAIGFDMGGTSSDVSLIESGEVSRAFESRVAGVRVKAPMLEIHTVAAGGGSLCRFDGFRLTVGPESAGAEPGPLCYGHPEARELALTDVNLWLGRLPPDRFPLPVAREPVERAFERIAAELDAGGHDLAGDELAAGFVEIANANMAEAIARVSVARGVDPRDHALVGFGGAAGQHVCAVARRLGMHTILLHPLAGLLSAYGIGRADATWDGQRDAGRLGPGTDGRPPAAVRAILDELASEGRAALAAEGAAPDAIVTRAFLDMRYRGAETALAVAEPEGGDFGQAFERAHLARFGYARPGRDVELVTARVQARAPSEVPAAVALPPASRPSASPDPLRTDRVWFPGAGRVAAPVYAREALGPGARLAGPAVVLEDTGTIVLDTGFEATVAPDGTLRIEDRQGTAPRDGRDLARADPVRLEVMGNRFMSIAEQMGAVLQKTAVSTNIKERLDFSCAVFDGEGGLVANAPHIPVHLGAMGETVRAVRERFGGAVGSEPLARGDVIVTNDPFEGGSHLPDVTVVTPMFAAADRGAPDFFVASRGHHADIGGKTPGSMPSDSLDLSEEGIVIAPRRLVREGRLDETGMRALLASGPFPARSPDDNLADLEAMVAANQAGVGLVEALVAEQGFEPVRTSMRELLEAAAAKVAREIGRLPDGRHRFEDALDDGTPVCVELSVEGERLGIDFTGTGSAVPGNLNAPRAVVQAAVIYVLRSLVAERIPLNGGCLVPVSVVVPERSLLDPPPGSAVVGGNVETSQRVVDVLLGALGVVAASQGTMNNVAFGNDRFGYYETIGGGSGAGPGFDGASGVHSHMTNTRITDAEVLEVRHPVRLETFALRRGSGGEGRQRGGDGLVRRYRFLEPVTVSLLTERRQRSPYGLAGGAAGAPGENRLERRDGTRTLLASRATVSLAPGDALVVETPGGGGYGEASSLAATRHPV